MNLWDILILIIIGAALFLALLSRRKARREGRSCCSEGCSACDKCSTADRRS